MDSLLGLMDTDGTTKQLEITSGTADYGGHAKNFLDDDVIVEEVTPRTRAAAERAVADGSKTPPRPPAAPVQDEVERQWTGDPAHPAAVDRTKGGRETVVMVAAAPELAQHREPAPTSSSATSAGAVDLLLTTGEKTVPGEDPSCQEKTPITPPTPMTPQEQPPPPRPPPEQAKQEQEPPTAGVLEQPATTLKDPPAPERTMTGNYDDADGILVDNESSKSLDIVAEEAAADLVSSVLGDSREGELMANENDGAAGGDLAELMRPREASAAQDDEASWAECERVLLIQDEEAMTSKVGDNADDALTASAATATEAVAEEGPLPAVAEEREDESAEPFGATVPANDALRSRGRETIAPPGMLIAEIDPLWGIGASVTVIKERVLQGTPGQPGKSESYWDWKIGSEGDFNAYEQMRTLLPGRY